MNKEEIVKALNVIKKVCIEQKSCCMDCPFYSHNDGCYIINNYPDKWNIQDENDVWRAFYD